MTAGILFFITSSYNLMHSNYSTPKDTSDYITAEGYCGKIISQTQLQRHTNTQQVSD